MFIPDVRYTSERVCRILVLMFGTKVAPGRSLVVFDISASSVGAAVAHGDLSAAPSLLWVKRVEFGYQNGQDYTQYARLMLSALLEVGMALAGDGMRVASLCPGFDVRHLSLYCVLGSPWCFTSVETASYAPNETFEITHSLLDAQRNAMYTTTMASEACAAWQAVTEHATLLEVHDLSTRVNGYAVDRVEGRRAAALAQTVCIAVAPEAILEQVREVLSRVLPVHVSRVQIQSAVRVLVSGYVRKHGELARNMFFVNISGQISDIVCVRKGIPQTIRSVPVGMHDILTALAPRAQSYMEAVSEAKIALSHAHPKDFSDLIEGADSVVATFRDALISGLGAVVAGAAPPHRVCVVCDEDWYPLFEKILETPWVQPGVRKPASLAVDYFAGAKETIDRVLKEHDVRLEAVVRAVDDA